MTARASRTPPSRPLASLTLALIAAAALAAAQPPPSSTSRPPQRPGEIVRPNRPGAPASGTEGTATIKGRVTAADGRPLRLARVSITDGATRRSVAESTDADGRYEFTEVFAGTYTVAAHKAGYATMEFGQRKPTDPGKRIRIIDDQHAEHIDFTLPSASALTGRVVDENGDPVEGAAVSLYTMSIVGGRRRLIASGTDRRTDDLGRFRLFNVNPGEYVIAASAATQGTHRLPGYARAFFPGSPAVADAQVVAVKTGDDLFGLDVRLSPGRAARVSGVALDETGQPLQGTLLLDTSRRSGQLAAPALRAHRDPDGRFEFGNVAPGDYVLQASGRGRNGIEFAARFLVVGDEDIAGLTMRTATGSVVRGQLVLDGRSRTLPRDFQFNFVTINEDGSPEPGSYRAKINDDWTFEYDGLFGTLLIRPIARPEWLLRSVRVNGVDITDTSLSFGRRDDSLVDVEVVMTNRGAEVSGSAIDPRGQTGAPYTVIAFAADRDRWTRYSRFVKAARSEPDGTFTVRGLPTGEYFVAAVDRIQASEGSGEWDDPAFLEALVPAAVRVALEEGRTGSAAPKLTLR